MRLAITRRVCLLIGAAALASAFVSGCGSGGLDFNGVNTSGLINPRSSPVVHFPMPVETFNEVENAYEIDNIVVFVGRQAPSAHPGQPQWSEPQADPLPVTPTAFSMKSSTDVWETHAQEDRNNNLILDEADGWGPNAFTHRAQAMSVTCQWLAQQVNGNPRTDVPIVFENVEFESIAISIVGQQPSDAPRLGRNTQRQNPVSNRIGLRGALGPNEDIATDNEHAANNPVPMPGSANHLEVALGVTAPPGILFGKWQESKQENLFVESMNFTLTDAPVSGFFSSNGKQTLNGGLYAGRLAATVTPAYNPNLNIAFYYSGVALAHVIGLGSGLEQNSFQRPGGASNGEEDIMSVQVELDQSFFTTAGRRFQFTSEGLLHFQNTQRYPLGSPERADAAFRSLSDQFDPLGLRRGETAPGPMR